MEIVMSLRFQEQYFCHFFLYICGGDNFCSGREGMRKMLYFVLKTLCFSEEPFFGQNNKEI